MAIKESPKARINGNNAHNINASKLSSTTTTTLPHTSVTKDSRSGEESSHTDAQSHPGPTINGKPTTITLHASYALQPAGLIPSIHDLLNDAFSVAQSRSGTMPYETLRLQSHDQLVKELSGKSTFTYVMTYTGTKTVIGVASAKRYHEPSPQTKQGSINELKSAFVRTGASQPNTEGWELSSMAVEPSLQRQGLAGLLVELVEAEVKRRFLLDRVERGTPDLGLVMLLSTIKEINLGFYSRRKYQPDYETFQRPGYDGSATGFTVVHMSKRVAI